VQQEEEEEEEEEEQQTFDAEEDEVPTRKDNYTVPKKYIINLNKNFLNKNLII
jgi:hypothetical protein